MQMKLDTVRESDFHSEGTYVQVSRGGVVYDITDEDAEFAADYFFVVAAAIRDNPLLVSSTGTMPGRPDLFYQGAQIVGTSGRSVQFKANFASFTATVASVYTITDRCFQAAYEGNLAPGTRKPIKVGLFDSDPKKTVKPRLATMRFNRTMRVLSVTKLIYGNGETDRANGRLWVNTTNDATFQGLDPAYWACSEYGVLISRYSGYYLRTISAISKTDEDVSEFEFLKSSITDKHVVDMETIDDTVAAINNIDYKYGIINDSGDADLTNTHCGVVRVGPYKLADFETLFGFTSSSTL